MSRLEHKTRREKSREGSDKENSDQLQMNRLV